MAQVILIGAGISGLATATFLHDAGVDVQVLEAAAHPGGNVRSDRVDGRVLDQAANGWLDSEPAMSRLLDIAGLSAQVVPASDRYKTRWIYADGAMHPAPLSPPALLRSPLLSLSAKLRLLAEPFIRPGPAGVEESVGEFVRRRLGPGALDRLVAPMVAGIYAGDPDAISLKAAFPRMVELEQAHGSLVRAMVRLRGGGAPTGHLVSLKGGAGALTEGLAARLGERVRCDTPVQGLERAGGRWVVHTPDDALTADAVVLACPGYAASALVARLDPPASAALAAIPYAPVAVVVSAWPERTWARPPEGFGVLLARGEDLGGVLGCVFSSCVFPEQSRPGEVLLRTIIGGAIHPDAARLPDQQLIARARAANTAFFGPERAGPALVRVYRHPRGIPQYTLGHPGRVREVRAAEARHGGLCFVGNHLRGVGVKDCAKAAEEAAHRVRAHLCL
ncbi:MAG: protoporphyrinogen oxidase [Alphaproteobacteria bacterium]|nr:protoporphyrinogen oxidase [Alphaproteobacteria bacterium]